MEEVQEEEIQAPRDGGRGPVGREASQTRASALFKDKMGLCSSCERKRLCPAAQRNTAKNTAMSVIK